MTRSLRIFLLMLVSGVAGCSVPGPRPLAGVDSEIHLTATLISPTDIALKWTDPATNAAGHIVEFATDPKGTYTILGFLAPNQTTFTHPDLMPETTWYYRIRAFYGPASNPVHVHLPERLSDADYAARYAVAEDYSWGVPQTIPAKDAKTTSIRNAKTAAEAGPTDLKATLMTSTVSGFKLTWTDHARDEEGYLLEIKSDGDSDFHVCALLDPNINSFGYAFEPPVRHAVFRVRAFYYGKPSPLAWQTTGKAPAGRN